MTTLKMNPEGDPVFRHLYETVTEQAKTQDDILDEFATITHRIKFPVIGANLVCLNATIGSAETPQADRRARVVESANRIGRTVDDGTIANISVLFARAYVFRDKVIAVDYSPTYESMDGEYHFLVDSPEEIKIKLAPSMEHIAKLEKTILDRINNNEIEISYVGSKYDINVIESSRITILLLALSWMLRSILTPPFHVEKDFAPFLGKLGNLPIRDEEINMILGPFMREWTTKMIGIGTKMIPISVEGIIHIENPSYNPWNEILIQRLVYDLVVNKVCNSFAPLYFWSLVKADEHYYQNSNIVKKYEYSKKAKELINTIEEMDEYTGMTPIELDVQKLVTDTKQQLILSDYSIVFGTKHYGATLASYIYKMKIRENPLHEWKRFNSILLGYLFSLSAVHEISNIVHGDLHLNNVLLALLTESVDGFVYFGRNQIDSYFIENSYLKPSIPFAPYVIDFSRSIFLHGSRETVERILGKSASDEIFMNQGDKIVQLCSRVVKDVDKHQELLRGLIFTDYSEVSKVLRIIDFYIFFMLMRTAFTADLIDKKIISAVKKGEIFCKEELFKNFHHLIKRDFGKIDDRFDEKLRQTLFSDYSLVKNIAEVSRLIESDSNDSGTSRRVLQYNLNAEMKFSLLDPKKELISTKSLQNGWDEFSELVEEIKRNS